MDLLNFNLNPQQLAERIEYCRELRRRFPAKQPLTNEEKLERSINKVNKYRTICHRYKTVNPNRKELQRQGLNVNNFRRAKRFIENEEVVPGNDLKQFRDVFDNTLDTSIQNITSMHQLPVNHSRIIILHNLNNMTDNLRNTLHDLENAVTNNDEQEFRTQMDQAEAEFSYIQAYFETVNLDNLSNPIINTILKRFSEGFEMWDRVVFLENNNFP